MSHATVQDWKDSGEVLRWICPVVRITRCLARRPLDLSTKAPFSRLIRKFMHAVLDVRRSPVLNPRRYATAAYSFVAKRFC